MRCFIVLLSIVFSTSCQNYVNLKAEYRDDGKAFVSVRLNNVKDPDTCFIYRSYENLNKLGEINLSEYPISKFYFKINDSVASFTDSLLADNCTYFYYMKIKTKKGKFIPSTVDSIQTINKEVVNYNNKSATIFIDKKNYFLEIQVDGIGIKRYPINLGIKPWNRKLHFDKMSTPEGKYHLTHFNYKSSFHKSMGVSYPNSEDRERYAMALKNKKIPKVKGKYAHIGGSITIHGGGVGNNWTWGCIAMRNRDIDEILKTKCIKVNTPIYIVGNEVTKKDLY